MKTLLIDDHEVQVWWAVDDNCYFAQSEDYPTCSAWGETEAKALEEFRVMVSKLDTLQESREVDIPTADQTQVTL